MSGDENQLRSGGGQPASAPTAETRPGPDWALRLVLGVVLAGLLTTVVLVSTRSPGTKVVATAAAPALGSGGSGRSQAGSAPAPTTISASTAPAQSTTSAGTAPASTTPAGASSTQGAPPWRTAGIDCGLSLHPGAPSGPVGHCTVLEIGDSLGNDLGWGLARHLAATSGLHLVQADVSATGLVDTSFYDWPARLATDLRQYHPQLVLVSLGGNDQQGMMVGGSAVQFPTAAWKRAYLARVRALVKESTAAGAYVLWVGMPIMQQPGFSAGMEILDSLYQQAVDSDPDSAFVSVWKLFAGPGGKFETDAIVNGSLTGIREPDGVHYAFAGEDVIATYVIRQIASTFHVRLSAEDPAVITGWG